MNKRTELALLLHAGQQAEAQAPPSNASRGLDRVWSAAAHEGLVSPTPPPVAYPPRYPARIRFGWRRIAVIVAIIGVLALAGSVFLWQQANRGEVLINTDIPGGDR